MHQRPGISPGLFIFSAEPDPVEGVTCASPIPLDSVRSISNVSPPPMNLPPLRPALLAVSLLARVAAAEATDDTPPKSHMKDVLQARPEEPAKQKTSSTAAQPP